MKHKTKILTTLGVVGALAIGGYAVASSAHGQYHERHGGYEFASDSHKKGGHKGVKRMMRMLESYDVNEDGALTLDEITTERGKKFKSFDANNDGTLDLNEYQALWADAMRERMVDQFQKHDDDGDGKINEDDFSRKFTRMMAWMDRNGDGKIDREDRKGGDASHDKD